LSAEGDVVELGEQGLDDVRDLRRVAPEPAVDGGQQFDHRVGRFGRTWPARRGHVS